MEICLLVEFCLKKGTERHKSKARAIAKTFPRPSAGGTSQFERETSEIVLEATNLDSFGDLSLEAARNGAELIESGAAGEAQDDGAPEENKA